MTALEWVKLIMLVIAIALSITVSTFALIKAAKEGFTNKWIVLITLSLGLLFLVYLSYNVRTIEPAENAQIMLLAGLIAVTGIYAFSAVRQADASVKMAEEMRSQGRPIVIQKVLPARSVPYKLATDNIIKNISSDYFEICNVGNGPAIELEILLLGREENLLESNRKTPFLRAGEMTEFYPQGLENHVDSVCYLLCRYRRVPSSGEKQMWYKTRLPFEPIKSQRGDRIIIKPGDLEFSEDFEKKSY